MMHSQTVQNISVGVTYPENIKILLNKHFSIQKVNNYTSILHLETSVDIEQIYLDTVSTVHVKGRTYVKMNTGDS
jgi:hypothetical protein